MNYELPASFTRCEVFTAMRIHVLVIWVVTTCSVQ